MLEFLCTADREMGPWGPRRLPHARCRGRSMLAFSNCRKRGLLSNCGALASHSCGFSCCRAQALGHAGLVIGKWAQSPHKQAGPEAGAFLIGNLGQDHVPLGSSWRLCEDSGCGESTPKEPVSPGAPALPACLEGVRVQRRGAAGGSAGPDFPSPTQPQGLLLLRRSVSSSCHHVTAAQPDFPFVPIKLSQAPQLSDTQAPNPGIILHPSFSSLPKH